MALSPEAGNGAIGLEGFSFSDGQPLAFAYDGTELLLDYRNWQELTYRLRFRGVAMVRAYGGGVSLCEAAITTDSEDISDARTLLRDDWATGGVPDETPLTQLTIIDDVPVLTVVFRDVAIEGPIREADRLTNRLSAPAIE